MAIRYYVFGMLAILSYVKTTAQFIESSGMLGAPIVTGPNEMGKAISFHDIDRNGWDDISIARGALAPRFLLNQDGVLTEAPFTITNFPAANINMLLWADYDNDGDADLLITKENAPLQLWRNNGDWQFTDVTVSAGLELGIYLYKGAAFCDYDHDGHLDLYISKFYTTFNPGLAYRGILYHNNGNGTFTNVTGPAGVLIPSAPIFQPVFFDHDNDGWEDLFLVVDRVFHRNELFRNNGDGTFTNISEASGMAIQIDAMSGTIGDPDNDGDLDVFITNDPPVGHFYMRNNGDGTFTNSAPQVGLNLAQVGWGALWLDYDNDTYEDLFVSVTSPGGSPIGNQFYVNQQQGTQFAASNAQVGLGGDLTETYICAMGDVNGDGYYDFVTSNHSNNISKLYMNDGGNNNWLAVGLQGTLANRDGIGTWLHCYAGGEHYVRYTLCGSDLMNQNSSRVIFGLGQHTVVDSLVLQWNSGTHEVYVSPQINTQHHFIEGASFLPTNLLIGYSGPSHLCPGDSALLDAGDFQSYAWNTGDSLQTLIVHEPGTYQVVVTNGFGFEILSDPLIIEPAPELVIDITVTEITCHGLANGSILVETSNDPLASISWTNGVTDNNFINALEAGSYGFELVDAFGCTGSGVAEIFEPEELISEVATTNVLCHGEATGSVLIEASGGTGTVEVSVGEFDPQALGAGEYVAMIEDQNGCILLVPFSITEPMEFLSTIEVTHVTELGSDGTATLTLKGGTPPYSILWSTGAIAVLNVVGLNAGQYHVSIQDDNDCTLAMDLVIGTYSGIEEQTGEEFKVYPVPALNELRLTGYTGVIEYQVLDLAGRIHSSVPGHSSSMPLLIGTLAPANYVLVVRQNGSTRQFSFVKHQD